MEIKASKRIIYCARKNGTSLFRLKTLLADLACSKNLVFLYIIASLFLVKVTPAGKKNFPLREWIMLFLIILCPIKISGRQTN